MFLQKKLRLCFYLRTQRATSDHDKILAFERSHEIERQHSLLPTVCGDQGLKWYYDQKIIPYFPSDFESVFA